MIEINYSAFYTIEEQLKDYEVSNIELLERLKDEIIMLYLHNILTESQKNTAFNRLHKKVMKNIKGRRMEDDK